ncbi:MAG TPA: GNAT family N-acetyltransferase [Bauldia sp.]|nr:GNAT family N-acetyltransferase [Bauldia sp.]
MEVVVRPAGPADIHAVTAIYGHSVLTGTASFELQPPDEAEMARRHAAILAAGYPYLAAERQGAVLGYAYAGPFRPRPGYRHTVEDSVYVAASAQRQGVGRALLAALIAECEARDFRQMIAVIGDSAHVASIELHAAQGFRVVGTYATIGHKFGRWIDSVHMQRALGKGASAAPTR